MWRIKPVGHTSLTLSSLAAHVRGFLTVAGADFRKNAGN